MNARQEKPARLSPEAAGLVETYFGRVHGALLVAATGECEETVEDLRAHVYEQIAETAGTPDDVARVLADLGTPEVLAAQCADLGLESSDKQEVAPRKPSPFAGSVLGLPYDLRPPTPERIASRWWDPLNPRILVPRVFGVGWDVNFGAVAVRLGLVRPDDEDVPFGSVPTSYLALAVVLPVAIAAVLAVLIVLYQSGLPAQVPVHWGISGAPDRFDGKDSALVLPVLMTVFGLVVVAGAWLGQRRPLSRVAAGALATLFATISTSVYVQELAAAAGGRDDLVMFAGLALALALPFALLVTLSRIGRAAEVRRDLAKKGDLS